MIKASPIFRKDERNWSLIRDRINQSFAEGVALATSEDNYTHIVNYNPDDPEHGYAVYIYWRLEAVISPEEETLPDIKETLDWKIKRLKHAINHQTSSIQKHNNTIAKYLQELTNLTGVDV